jgi:hypothetical protein
MNIVFYVARSYRRPRIKRVRVKRIRASKSKEATTNLPDDGSDPDDELGLEEA